MGHFSEERGGGAATQRAHEDDGEEVGRKPERDEQGGERAFERFDATGTAEHADGDEDRDEERDDANGDLKSLLRAVDKFLVNFDAAQRRVEWEEHEEKGHREQRERADGAQRDVLGRSVLPRGQRDVGRKNLRVECGGGGVVAGGGEDHPCNQGAGQTEQQADDGAAPAGHRRGLGEEDGGDFGGRVGVG